MFVIVFSPSKKNQGSARRVAWHVLGRLETMFRVVWMVNLLLFLKSGKYASPVDRLVQMRMVNENVFFWGGLHATHTARVDENHPGLS